MEKLCASSARQIKQDSATQPLLKVSPGCRPKGWDPFGHRVARDAADAEAPGCRVSFLGISSMTWGE